ncbi:hypothetical protein ONS95_008930 [Cadophora gregata]|uniref:uncharacterized protein n=1 Tax=Cadophora gregata TaxID=51156 RepID=UPI0026DD49DD|nr:uncharacterized protein ONS95_008930 [Cadophora gregata]KAK0123940.1 hypothetical protein ONS95_008930 [Cadophora gregata]
MPLISEMPRGREAVETFSDPSPLLLAKRTEGVSLSSEQDQIEGQDRHRGYDHQHFEEFDQDECLDSDMEGSILHRPRPKKVVKTPVLPQRSEKRTSKILDNVLLELKNINGSLAKENDISRLDQEDPHELYLSSEEDASLSDDYEDTDSLLDFEETYSEDENGGSSSRASSRRSEEITATAVSFMVVKPHIVEIHIPSNHTAPVTPADEKPDSMDAALPTITTKAPSPAPQVRPAMRRPPPLNLHNARPMSMATTSSYIPSTYTPAMTTNASMVNLSTTGSVFNSARKSSRLASLVTSTKASLSARTSSFSASSTHSFLDSDPFAQSSTHTNPPLTPTDMYTPITPKTPTSQSAWKKSISRTLSKAARKPSLQKINLAYNTSLSNTNTNFQRASTMSSSTMPPLSRITSNPEPTTPKLLDDNKSFDSNTEPSERIIEVPVRRAETMPVTPSPREAPMQYQELMKNRVPPPIPENTAQQQPREGRKSFSLGMGLGRKKSLKR